MKVQVTGNLPDDLLAPIVKKFDTSLHPHDRPMEYEALLAVMGDKQGLLCMITDRVDQALLAQAPRLRIVANFGVGYNNIDVEAATARGILVTNTPGVLTDATADLTMALVLAVGRRVVESDIHTRAGNFNFWSPYYFLGHEISGKTLGIIGMGRIGQAVAHRAAGFNMPVLYNSRHRVTPELEEKLNARSTDLKSLLQESDFVSLHVPLTAETRHMIGPWELSLMKPGAFLINTSRGPVLDEQALLAALQQGVIAGAGLDVYENEPAITPGLVELSNVVLLPHVGSATVETRRRMGAMAVDNLLAGLEGRIPPNCINPQAIET